MKTRTAKAEKKTQTEVVQASVGSLIEALYDAVPKTIRNAQHKTLLVVLALKDLQTKMGPA
jgi:hypothetical protein